MSESEELNLVAEKRMFKPQWIRPPEDFMESNQVKEFSQRLVHHYLRRMEFRGSDVRLDLGIVFRPDAAPRTSIDPSRWIWTVAHSWPFRGGAHQCVGAQGYTPHVGMASPWCKLSQDPFPTLGR